MNIPRALIFTASTAAVYGGYMTGRSFNRAAFRNDLAADPFQHVESIPGGEVYTPVHRTGDLSALGLYLTGALVAGGGAALGYKAPTMAFAAGSAIFFAGTGLIAAGVATSMLYSGARLLRQE